MSIFIHIGYPKTATTWLQKVVFPNQPGILFWDAQIPGGKYEWLLDIVNVHDFDFDPTYFRSQYARCRDDHSKPLVISLESLVGDPFAGNRNSRSNADRLRAIFPEATIIITIREQLSILISLYKQYVQEGGASSLGRFLESESVPTRTCFSLDFLQYDRIIDYYQQLFGVQAVHVFLYEELKEEPERFLETLFALFQIDVKGIDDSLLVERPNQGLSTISLAIARIANRFLFSKHFNPSPIIPWTRLFRASRVRRILQQRLDPLVFNRISGSAISIKPELQQRLEDYYRESNAIVADKLGIDLRKYGYPL